MIVSSSLACAQPQTPCVSALQCLGTMHGLHAVAAFLGLMKAYTPGQTGERNTYSIIVLNSINLAVATR